VVVGANRGQVWWVQAWGSAGDTDQWRGPKGPEGLRVKGLHPQLIKSVVGKSFDDRPHFNHEQRD
jgi:hypothetical protein